MGWLAKIFGWVGSFILEKVVGYVLDKISRIIAKKRASQAQLEKDEDNAKKFKESKTDEERHKSGEDLLNG